MWRWAAIAGLLAAAPTSSTPAAQATSAVEHLRVEVLASYPHDTEAFTQGLELHDGVLYEGTGRYGESDLRTVEVRTGEVRDRVALPDAVFGEGITVVGNRIWQLTFQEEFAFLRDRRTLAETDRAEYTGEGWGLCHDPARHRLVMSDGTSQLTFRDPETFDRLGSVAVTQEGEPLTQINELECAGGKVWANIWMTDKIVRIDPGTGTVEAVVDASGLLSESERAGADVLNGIAAVPRTDTFLITGKLWPRMFRVRFSEARSAPL
ncbi:MAG: glutaminyl-peptide cyclotransferase [Streptosporangiales bacterium]|nr:glutaminyl-peptide cyclotransferase [Streptosporangiales bacterium]